MPNMENYFVYGDFQWQLVSHILVFGFGAMVAGLVYFLVTARQIAPKYRATSYISAVVMVSAALILFNQYWSWDQAFNYVPPVEGQTTGWVGPAADDAADPATAQTTFSNGYRYMNWSIDVPMLQIQLLAVIGLAGAAFFKLAAKFTIGGLLMIYTSYVAQFYEWGFHDQFGTAGAVTLFWVFYLLSWLAYLYILYVIYTGVFRDVSYMPERAQKVMRGIWWLLLGSWTMYAIAIVMPAISFSEHGGVWRQFIFTFADVISKVIYGAMLGHVAMIRSAHEGYAPAVRACSTQPASDATLHDELGQPITTAD